MADIETREHARDIKILDKSISYGERMKLAFVRSKSQTRNLVEEGESSPTEYAENRVQAVTEDVMDDVAHEVKFQVDKRIEQGRNAYREHRQEVRAEKKARKVDEAIRKYDASYEASAYRTDKKTYFEAKAHTAKSVEKSQKTIKTVDNTTKGISIKGKNASLKMRDGKVKTAQETSKATIKTVETSAKAAGNAARNSAQAAKVSTRVVQSTAKATVSALKAATKATVEIVKDFAAGTKALISAIIAGGWVAIVVVLVLCMIAMIAGSSFGIFFSNENTGSGQNMYEVVQEINEEYKNEIEEIKKDNPHDEIEIVESRAAWQEILTIYAVKVSADPDNAQDVAVVTTEKKAVLRDIFWDMNEITHSESEETVTTIIDTVDANGNAIQKEVEEIITTLRIEITCKTADEMAREYWFSGKQKKQLAELLDSENDSVWADVLKEF